MEESKQPSLGSERSELAAYYKRMAIRVRGFLTSLLLLILARWGSIRLWAKRWQTGLELLAWAIILAIAFNAQSQVQIWLDPFLSAETMTSIQAVALAVGAAMIGATAIASSFVLFALQVNVERLPYALFYKFSFDPKLLTSIAMSFVFAISCTAFSIISNSWNAYWIICGEFFAVLIVLRLLFLAYSRSIQIVSPVFQLEMIERHAHLGLKRIDRLVNSAISPKDKIELTKNDLVNKSIIYNRNSKWDYFLIESIENVALFARNAGQNGDFQISKKSLNTVLLLNRLYIKLRGQTFFGSDLFSDNSLSNDRVINETLESTRRLREASIARRDEVHLVQILETQSELSNIYIGIEYINSINKTHANLAAYYLTESVEAAYRHQLIDNTLLGIRLIGKLADGFLASDSQEDAVFCISKIGNFGLLGCFNNKHHPLVLTSMDMLKKVLLTTILVESRSVNLSINEINNSIFLISEFLIKNEEKRQHLSFLNPVTPIFSSTSENSLRWSLTAIVNSLHHSKDPEIARRIADNLEVWSDSLYRKQKDVLLKAIERRSSLTFDMIRWVTGIAELLIVTSRSQHTRKHTKDELEKNALWLLLVLTFIPTDNDTVRFIERLSFRVEVFETAIKAQDNNWDEGFDEVWKLLLKWAIEGGREHTGWGTLERWLTALCALALRGGVNLADQLTNELKAKLASSGAPSHEMRDRAAEGLRRKITELGARQFELDPVERVLASNDRQSTVRLLDAIAAILSDKILGGTSFT